MEFVDGASLRQLVDAHPKGMPIRTAQRILTGILRALEHAHGNNVIHRDVKPANILIRGGSPQTMDAIGVDDVKVTDFGLGRAGEVTTASIMQSGSLLAEDGRSISGTLAYMAPEQRDGQDTDARTDLYSVGIVLFEMACGERPSGSDLPSHVREDLPPWVDSVFSRLYTRRERRFAGADEVLRLVQPTDAPPIARSATSANLPPIPQTDSTAARACPACRSPLDADDNYCIMCGSQIAPHIRRCLVCGAYPAAQDQYCIECGTTLTTPVGF
jgi:serine/threonine-protein kinase